jgi:hypothetical protein
MIAKTSLQVQLSTSICYGASFLPKSLARAAKIDSAAGHLFFFFLKYLYESARELSMSGQHMALKFLFGIPLLHKISQH